jgi:hypothetical protein
MTRKARAMINMPLEDKVDGPMSAYLIRLADNSEYWHACAPDGKRMTYREFEEVVEKYADY